MRDEVDGLEAALARAAKDTRRALDRKFTGLHSPVSKAMQYALKGGKGLRAFLVVEGASMFGVERRLSAPVAAAVECIHAYSLVHDDMPMMDDDDMRRGRPTVHRKYGEATALLVGDALQSLAFELFDDASGYAVNDDREIPDRRILSLSVSLARASGVRGMVEGQAQDIAAETVDRQLSINEITELQSLKTGALIVWSAEAGAKLAGEDWRPLRTYGRALGLAFQIADDLLDVNATSEEVGKRTGKDAGRGKATFVTHLGEEGARKRAEELVEEAVAALETYGASASLLHDAARFAINRRS